MCFRILIQDIVTIVQGMDLFNFVYFFKIKNKP